MSFKVGAPYEGGGTVYIFLGAVEGVAGAPRVGRQWLKAEQLASQVIFSSCSMILYNSRLRNINSKKHILPEELRVVALQVIRAEQLVGAGQRHLPIPSNLATFGSSLAGGMDMDSNGYPGRT